MSNLRICLFGRFRVTFDDDASEVKLTRIAQTLLAYLLLQHTFSSRDVLASLCWGDRPDEQARNCLNTALWRLRRALGGDRTTGAGRVITAPTGEVGFHWASPDYNEKWQEGSICTEDMTESTSPCRIVKAAASGQEGKWSMLTIEAPDTRLAGDASEVLREEFAA